MSEIAVTCSYTFTKAEHRRAMRVFWLETPKGRLTILFFVLLAGVMPAWDIYVTFTDPTSPHGATALSVFLGLLPPAVFLLFIFGILFFQSSLVFRKGPFFNQPFRYVLDKNECRLQTPSIEMKLQWSALKKWRAGKTGFIVYLKGGRSFHWFPYSGFQSPQDIEWTRGLLESHVGNQDKSSS